MSETQWITSRTMCSALITYEGYALYEWGRGYKSEVDGKWIEFDSAGQWKRYIDNIKRK